MNDEQIVLQEMQRDKAVARKLKQLIQGTAFDIQSELNTLFRHFREQEGIYLVDMLKRANKQDIERFRHRLMEFNSEEQPFVKNFIDSSITKTSSRMDLVEASINLAVGKLIGKELVVIEDFLMESAEIEYKRNNTRSITITNHTRKNFKEAVHATYHGATVSERVWMNGKGFQRDLIKSVEMVLKQGLTPAQASKKMMKYVNEQGLGKGKAAYRAKALVTTESTRVQTMTQKLSYEELGIDEYQYLAEPTACKVCSALHGNIYKVKDMESGVNASPMHTFCKCRQRSI